ncbi:MAG TPA: sterol desaturase [Myxococcales bacterium]|nr:sterol desaturase [Deltaproteobacteria bacterium]MBU49728.1 sterol desaturase [Deltaproteobacteria bacterium]HAA59165.1 sterol desaturase [Myxococcales bacterium]
MTIWEALDPYVLMWVWGILFTVVLVRYLVMSGVAYMIFWKWQHKRLQHRRIQQKFPKPKKVRNEVLWSLSTFVIFALNGIAVMLLRKADLTLGYKNISDYGWAYYVFSILLMIVVHDAYFYWTHRTMHHKKLFKYFHAVHHHSHNPSPWAAFAFHPLEAVVEAGIIYVFLFAIPHHISAIGIFLLFMTFMNVLGHLGYELFPKNFVRHPVGQWVNTSTHHNMHHHRSKGNFSLYFNWWDRWMGTNHEKYFETYDEVTHRPKVVEETTAQTEPQAVAGVTR